MKCKITGEKITPFMSFGKMPLANGFLKKEEFEKEFFFEMEVGFSEKLSLFQLNDFPSPEKMFNKEYPFYTGSSSYMKSHFKDYADWIKKNYLSTKSNLVEIGSNDGTFLKNFVGTDINYLGFEPSENVAKKAIKNNVNTKNIFFNKDSIEDLKNFKSNTNVICAANVICHIPNLKDLISSIEILLSKKGVFIFEEPYMGSMFSKVSYDQIYDEHIYIFSISSVKKIFSEMDFELFRAVPQITHGGSMRYYIRRKSKKINNFQIDEIEKKLGIDTLEACLKFKKNCEFSKEKTIETLNKFKNDGLKISGYAATSKSTTILNYCNLSEDIIDCIYDTTPEKIGKFSPGMHIPIKNSSNFKNNYPDVAYLFAWNHKDEIQNKEKSFTDKGGKWFSHVEL